jgi:hypothetical protein
MVSDKRAIAIIDLVTTYDYYRQQFFPLKLLKKRCRILPAGCLGVSPRFINSPETGGYRGLIKIISALSPNWSYQ